MKKRLLQRITFIAMRGVTYFIVLVIAYILIDIAWKGLPAISWKFLFSFPSDSGFGGGILPAILGTIYLTTGTILIALPLGMASAVFLTEYAKQGYLNQSIRLAIVTLAGVPSIVFGLFGLGLFVLFCGFGVSIISGSLTLACMILPTIIVSSEEALRSVPRALREGSLALGATKWQTIRRNVLPYAVPGMMTGAILGVGRAAGETAPILFTAAVAFKMVLPASVWSDTMALPYHLYYLATQGQDVVKVRPYQYGTAFVLLALVLAINLVAILIRSHFRKKYRW